MYLSEHKEGNSFYFWEALASSIFIDTTINGNAHATKPAQHQDIGKEHLFRAFTQYDLTWTGQVLHTPQAILYVVHNPIIGSGIGVLCLY